MATAETAAPVRLDDEQLLALASRYEKAKRLEGVVKRVARDCQDGLITELDERDVRSVRLGEDTQVTVVRQITTGYDAAGLYSDLSAAQRKRVFRAEVDLAALPETVRAQIIASLDPAVRRSVTRQVLDDVALETAVAAGRIPSDVAKHRLVEKRGAAYVRISHGPGK